MNRQWKAQLAGRLQQFKFYWVIQYWFKSAIHFNFWKTYFQGQHQYREEKSSYLMLRSTLFSFLKAVGYSIAIILLLESYNYFYPTNFQLNSESTDAFLATVASFSGVFLGLYFTAISSIASNLLLKAHQDVKDYFFSSPQVQQYVQTIEITGVVALFYLVTKSFNHDIHVSAFVFLSLLAAYVVLRFWKVGADVYNFAQPSSSLPRMMYEISRSVKDVVPPGPNWNKDFLQNHRAKQVNRLLDSAKRYIEFGVTEIKLKEEELNFALQHYAALLMFYAENKNKIPTNSYWYRTKYQYSSWALTDAAEIHMALHTGTPTSPKEIKDPIWFEAKVIANVMTVFDSYLQDKNYGGLFSSHDTFVQVAEEYGAQLDLEAIKLFVDEFGQVGRDIYKTEADDDLGPEKEPMAFVDSQGRLAIAVALGLSKYLLDHTCEEFVQRIDKINWRKGKRNVYLADLPKGVLERLESLAEELSNELTIEGKIVTESWYRQAYCLQRYLYAVKNYYDYVKTLHDDYYEKKLNQLVESKNFAYASQLIERWLEFSNKHINLVRHTGKCFEEAEQYKYLKDLPWPEFNLEEEMKSAEEQEKKVTSLMIALLPRLQQSVTKDEIPDHFGHALTVGTNACYQTCEDNDADRFAAIFPLVFNASLVAHQRTRDETEPWSQEESKIIYSTEPLVNLFEISGYGLLYGELHGNPRLRDIVEATWEQYLSGVPDAHQLLQFINAIVEYRSSIFKIMPQATLRSNWQIRFNHKMSERGLPVFPDIRGPFDDEPAHDSVLIRVISNTGGLNMRSAEEVFIELYLASLPAVEGVDFKNDLRESMERETRRRQENNDHE